MNPKKAVYVFMLLIIAAFQFALPYPAYAACSGVVYVNASSSAGSPDGCSWGTAFSKLQDALAIAGSGDKIWVAAGTYYPDEGTGQTNDNRNSTFFLKGNVSIYGGFTGSETSLGERNSNPATNNTVLNGDVDGTPGDNTGNAFHVVTADITSTNAVLDGFTVMNGNATGAALPNGAGILIVDSSPTFGNLIIRDGTANSGGGVYDYTSNPAVSESSYSRPTFANVTISNNTATEGGGIIATNSSMILNSVILTNNSASGGAGGGMYVNTINPGDDPSAPKLTNVTFSNNTARGGAGMYNYNTTASLNQVTFSNNTALRRGGGVLNENASPSFTNVTFYGNTSQESLGGTPWGGGGMINVAASNVTLNNVTFSGNDSVNSSGTAGGDAIRNTESSNLVIGNSIFWGDTDDEINADGSGTITISDSVVQGDFVGGTNIKTTDPNLSALAGNGGFTQTMAIGAGSSALNAGGVTTACATIDQRGVTRPQGSACDIGAYELNATLAVTINQAAGQLDPTNASSINFTVVFSEPVSNFATGDVTVSGTANPTTGTVTGSGTTYNVAVSGMTGNGTVIASIAAGVATNGLGASNQASTSTDNTVTYDTTGPTVTINQAAGQSDPTKTTPINFTVVFSEPVSNFATGDVTVSGTANPTTGTVTGSGTTYNVAVSGMTGDGTVIASIAAGVATDAAGNNNVASTSTDQTVTYDTTGPTVTINQAAGQADPTNASSINFTVVFSEPVSNFATGDVTVSGTANPTTGTVTGSGTTYNVAVSGMTGDGTVIASIAAGVATDAAGNNNVASTSTDQTVTYDTTGPTVTINQAAGQADPTNASSINFTVVFSEPVSNFATGDVTVSGTANPTTGTVTGSGTTYNVAVSGMTGNGTVIASIAAGVATDAAGNNNVASTSTDNTVTYDTTSLTVTINQAAGQSDPTKTTPINFTVVFSEPVSNFATGDVTVSGTANPTTGTVTGSGTTYNVAVSGMTGDGTVIASIAAGVATKATGASNQTSTSTDNTVTYDTTGPTVTINQAAGQSDPTSSSPISFTVVFNEAVTGFTAADIDLSASTVGGTLVASVSGTGPTYTINVTGMAKSGTVVAKISAGAAQDSLGNNSIASTSSDNSVSFTPPGKATLISPNGSISTNAPVYTWNEVPGATWYYLWINKSSTPVLKQWYSAAEANCNGTTCSVTPSGLKLSPGNYNWFIQTWNDAGIGPWSDRMDFTPTPPGKATLISPNGSISTNAPVYTWNEVPGATWYYLWINNSSGPVFNRWYSAAEANCNGTTCSVTPSGLKLSPGNYKWWVQTWNDAGVGPWSDRMDFTPTPPGKATLLSPSGNIVTNAPVYTWNEVPDATWYYLWINSPSGPVLKQWYTAAQANCDGTTCSVTPDGLNLASDNYNWFIQTWNDAGVGPWSDRMDFHTP